MEVTSLKQTDFVLYIGTRKIVLLAAAAGSNAEPRVLSRAEVMEPAGFKGGLVANLEGAAASLEALVEKIFSPREAEDISATVVLGNSRIFAHHYSSSQYYQTPRTVGANEIRSVIEQTRSVSCLPLSQAILQAVPESFLANDMDGIRNPTGLEASRLGVNLKIFSMDFQDFKNLSRALDAAGIEVKAFMPKALTVSEAVLAPEEKERGAAVIDIADDSAQVSLWKTGSFEGLHSAGWGGRYLSQKIAERWNLDFHDAEKVKERFATLEANVDFGEELIPLIDRYGKGSHNVRRQEFQESFVELAGQWLEAILKETDRFAADHRISHPYYVFTGGAVRLGGFLEFLQARFQRDGRIGVTRRVEAPQDLLVDPGMTGALGALRWLANYQREYERLLAPQGFLEKNVKKVKAWFCNYF
jgi:cell division protein FtsA